MILHDEILERVRDKIIQLSLDGMETDNVKTMKDASVLRQERIDIGFPGIAITHNGEAESYDGPYSTNAYEEVGYPVVVIAVDIDRTNRPDQTKDWQIKLSWREEIALAFLNRQLFPGVCRCTMESRPILMSSEWRERSLWSSPLMFRFWARLAR